MDTYYPPAFKKLDRLRGYVEGKVEDIADIVDEVEKKLGKEEFGYFKSELGDYFNEI